MSAYDSLNAEQLEHLANRVAQIVVHKLEAGLAQSNEDRLLSREEMAKKLGIGLSTLDRMTKSGDLPSLVISDRRMYCFKEVREFLIHKREVCKVLAFSHSPESVSFSN